MSDRHTTDAELKRKGKEKERKGREKIIKDMFKGRQIVSQLVSNDNVTL